MNVQVVRIFTSSTFTDMLMERNTLMEYVYPKIKERPLSAPLPPKKTNSFVEYFLQWKL
jgi:hypothetical protein